MSSKAKNGRTTRRASSVGEMAEPTSAPTQRRARSNRQRRRRSAGFIGLVSSLVSGVLVGVVCLTATLLWFNTTVTNPGPLDQTLTFKVEPSEGARTIAGRLAKAGIITSPNLFMAHYFSQSAVRRMNNQRPPILKTGTYEFEANASLETVMAVLERGRGALRFITFPEGLTSYAIVQRIMGDERLTGEVETMPAEGVLLPSTYDVQKGQSRTALLETMYAKQQELVDRLWDERAPDLPIQSKQEAIILASVVQREMGPNDDPKQIAGVFYNRLRRGMRLQSDPTILYGIFGGEVNWGKPILRSEIAQATAHNTYQIKGLPPTPICNPGLVALEAVLRPTPTDALFFVADGKGGHLFSKTLAEHREKTKEWRGIEREFRERQREEARLARLEADKAEAVKPVTVEARASEPISTASERATTAPAQPAFSTLNAKSVPTVRVSARPEQSAAVAATTQAEVNLPDGVVPLPIRKPRRN